jgi:FMN-dependent NADH-azoreductase
MKILHIDSSILGEHSVSRKLSAAIVRRLASLATTATVTYRDLASNPIPQFSPALAQNVAGVAPAPKDRPDVTIVEQVLEEVLAADAIVIGAPMYNFSVPSQLKSWLDALVVPGKTFRYSANGVEGLLGGRRVVIASSRGGFYGPDNAAEHQESLLRSLLGFVGVTDIEIVRAEGVRMGEEEAASAITAALDRAARLELAAA